MQQLEVPLCFGAGATKKQVLLLTGPGHNPFALMSSCETGISFSLTLAPVLPTSPKSSLMCGRSCRSWNLHLPSS